MKNPLAFPSGDLNMQPQDGMTLRDYFAGQALVSMVTELHMPPSEPDWARIVAQNAYKLADAMLAYRADPPRAEP